MVSEQPGPWGRLSSRCGSGSLMRLLSRHRLELRHLEAWAAEGSAPPVTAQAPLAGQGASLAGGHFPEALPSPCEPHCRVALAPLQGNHWPPPEEAPRGEPSLCDLVLGPHISNSPHSAHRRKAPEGSPHSRGRSRAPPQRDTQRIVGTSQSHPEGLSILLVFSENHCLPLLAL